MSIVTVESRRLKTREQGADLRARIHRAIAEHGRAIVNMRTVEQLHPRAADACFGVLAATHGADWVASHVALPDISTEFLIIIADAMQQRVKEAP
jgi:hypothetical protein